MRRFSRSSITALILSIAMVLTSTVYATDSNFKVTIANSSGENGQNEVVIPITYSNNTGFAGFSFCIDYDRTRLTLVQTEISMEGSLKSVTYPEDHGAWLQWSGVANNENPSGEIAKLHFTIKEDANSGRAYINATFRTNIDSIYDENEDNIVCDIVNGYIDCVNDHVYSDWITVQEATCTIAGIKKHTCDNLNCNHIEEVEIPTFGHICDVWTKDENFENNGLLSGICSRCGENLTKTVSYISLATEPIIKNYIEQEVFNSAGMTVAVHYDNGTEATATDYTYSPNGELAQSNNKITIAYGGKTTTQEITVAQKQVSSIIMKTTPTDTDYLEGAELNLDGGMITVNYNNGKSEDIDITADMISGYDSNVTGLQHVTVTYGNRTCQFDVIVQAKSLDHIAITSAPAITTYVEGQTFDPTGMVVMAYYDNNTVVTITDYVYSPDVALKISDKQVTISFGGKSAAQDITVLKAYDLSVSGTQYSVTVNVTPQPLFVIVSSFSDTITGKFTTSTMTKITDAQIGVPIVCSLPEGQYVISIVDSQFVPLTNCISNIGLYE